MIARLRHNLLRWQYQHRCRNDAYIPNSSERLKSNVNEKRLIFTSRDDIMIQHATASSIPAYGISVAPRAYFFDRALML